MFNAAFEQIQDNMAISTLLPKTFAYWKAKQSQRRFRKTKITEYQHEK